jgi:large subunit ribosomal protein L21
MSNETKVNEGTQTFAVVKTGGKQYRVSQGQKVVVELLPAEVGAVIDLGPVLMTTVGDKATIGTPVVAGASVKARILAHEKADKVVTYKKNRRTGYHKKQGHRQPMSHVVIESISL